MLHCAPNSPPNARALAVEQFDWRVLAQRLGAGLAPYDRGVANPAT